MLFFSARHAAENVATAGYVPHGLLRAHGHLEIQELINMTYPLYGYGKNAECFFGV